MSTINNINSDISANPLLDMAKNNTEYKQALQNTSLMGTAMTTMADIMLLFTELSNAKFAQMTDKTDVSRDAQDMANRVDRVIAELVEADDMGDLPADVVEYMRENNILVDGKTIDDFLADNGKTPNAKENAETVKNLQSMVDEAEAGNENGIDAKQFMFELMKNGVDYPYDNIDHLSKVSVGHVKDLINKLSITETSLDKGNLTAVKAALESASGRASDFVQQSQLKLQQLMQNFNTAVTMANSIQSMNAESTKSIAQSIR